jgi:hypothetical protein
MHLDWRIDAPLRHQPDLVGIVVNPPSIDPATIGVAEIADPRSPPPSDDGGFDEVTASRYTLLDAGYSERRYGKVETQATQP